MIQLLVEPIKNWRIESIAERVCLIPLLMRQLFLLFIKIVGSNLNIAERVYLIPLLIIRLFIWISSLFPLVVCNILSLCQRDVGFTGKTAAVIRHALRLLEDDVLVTQTQRNDCEEIRIEPKLVLPHVLNLAFYSNQVFELWRSLVSILICHPP